MFLKKRCFFIILPILAISFIFSNHPALAQTGPVDPSFNPNYIISDAEILDYNSMTQSEIQKFLEDKGSYLATYSDIDADGVRRLASAIIYNRCQANKVSPKFVLVLLQKEEGLTEDPSPRQGQLDWAGGYGCPDSGGCNARWQGFAKQVNSATLQFYDYVENPQDYNFKKGKTYSFENKYSTSDLDGMVTVTIFNDATAALYNYTPHVYNGNYNFWQLWRRYFTKTYPDGSLLQIKGDKAVWLIQSGKKRAFTSKSVLSSRFDEKKIIAVDKTILDGYPLGAPIKFPNFSLVKAQTGVIYLLVGDKKRLFASDAVFKKFGYNPAEVMKATLDDLKSYSDGETLTATSTYVSGALLQNVKGGVVYWVEEGKKAPLPDKVLLTYKFKGKKILKVSTAELAKYPEINPVLFDDGELLSSTATKRVFLISGGMKKMFASMDVFTKLGYNQDNVIPVSAQFLALYANGEDIK